MFTGIIEELGTVVSVEQQGGVYALTISGGPVMKAVETSFSMAVNGVCLTVVRASETGCVFEVIPETLRRTNIGDLEQGDSVNLERPLAANGRLDGHIVQGHVDAVGVVSKREKDGDDVRLYIDCNRAFCDYLVEKGSVAISGVSLTVVGVEDEKFDVALIPHTLAITTLRSLEIGSLVNLEADILGKYVKRYLSKVS